MTYFLFSSISSFMKLCSKKTFRKFYIIKILVLSRRLLKNLEITTNNSCCAWRRVGFLCRICRSSVKSCSQQRDIWLTKMWKLWMTSLDALATVTSFVMATVKGKLRLSPIYSFKKHIFLFASGFGWCRLTRTQWRRCFASTSATSAWFHASTCFRWAGNWATRTFGTKNLRLFLVAFTCPKHQVPKRTT